MRQSKKGRPGANGHCTALKNTTVQLSSQEWKRFADLSPQRIASLFRDIFIGINPVGFISVVASVYKSTPTSFVKVPRPGDSKVTFGLRVKLATCLLRVGRSKQPCQHVLQFFEALTHSLLTFEVVVILPDPFGWTGARRNSAESQK